VCVIIDANRVSATFGSPPCKDAVPILDWIARGGGKLVYGGGLASEYAKVQSAFHFVNELRRAGRAFELRKDEVHAEGQLVTAKFDLKSDDPHILAIARLSGARVLFSQDKNLHHDFRNSAIVAKPRGRVYKSREHAGFLHHDRSCKFVPGSSGKRRRAR
jgi:hypothetical protein